MTFAKGIAYLLIVILLSNLITITLLSADNPAPHNSTQAEISWLQKAAEYYTQGALELLENLLEEQIPSGGEEAAAKLFYQARLEIQQQKMISLLEQLITEYPDTEFGQLGLIELAKISLLIRDYQASERYLTGVTSGNKEKDFLLSTVFLKLNRFSDAIITAQRLIRSTNDPRKRELAYLTIVEAYIANQQYERALTTLQLMRTQNYIAANSSVASYKEGYCYEMLDRIGEAVAKYQYVIANYPFTDSSYQAEQKLYELTIAARINHTEMSVFTPTPEPADRTSTALPPITAVEGNYYIQVNAFSEAQNAHRHSRVLSNSGFQNIVFPKNISGQELYVVAVGPFETRQAALTSQKELQDRLDLDSFIIRYSD